MADQGPCSVCFRTTVIRVDGRIRHHAGLLIRARRVVGTSSRCTGAGLFPYAGPACPETGKCCPQSLDPRRCVHDESIRIDLAWGKPEVSDRGE